MNRSVHATFYKVFDRELSELLDTVLTGEVFADRDTAERLVRTVGACDSPRTSSCRPSPNPSFRGRIDDSMS